MEWKKFLVTIAALFFINVPVSAQVVTVQGSGTSEGDAIKDAKRVAVEEVIGMKIQSHSLAINSKLIFDTIQVRTQGYVTSCEVIKKNSSGGLVEITARVEVSDAPDSALMKDIDMVMNLNDPRLSVIMDHYGDDGGITFKKYSVACEAAIREELIKRGFTHVVDGQSAVDYVIIGKLSVGQAQEIKIPYWKNIGGDDFVPLETGLSRSVSTLDCKVKKFDTDEIIGEFQSTGNGLDASGNEVSAQAVNLMASSAAQQIREILSREASKVFSGVRIYVETTSNEKFLDLEKILNKTQGVSSVYVRSFKNGQGIIDADTALTPQNLYRTLTQTAGNSLTLQMMSFSSVTLEISVR